MRTTISSLCLVCLIASAQDGPKFEVASVRVSTAVNADISGGPGTTSPTQWRVVKFSLKNLISAAYGLTEDNIVLPDGLNRDARYDVAANMAPGTTKEQMALMLRALLADRWGLELHRESREVSGFELVIAKSGLKMKAAEVPVGPPERAVAGLVDAQGFPELPAGRPVTASNISGTHMRTTGKMQTMPQIAAFLRSELGGVPVEDRTGLSGAYDFKLHHAANPARVHLFQRIRAAQGAAGPALPPDDEGPAPELMTAVQEQLGLKLQSAKVPVDYVVVDRVLKAPTEN